MLNVTPNPIFCMISCCCILCLVNYPFLLPHVGGVDEYWSNSLQVTEVLWLRSQNGKRPNVLEWNVLKSQMNCSNLHNFIRILVIFFTKNKTKLKWIFHWSREIFLEYNVFSLIFFFFVRIHILFHCTLAAS